MCGNIFLKRVLQLTTCYCVAYVIKIKKFSELESTDRGGGGGGGGSDILIRNYEKQVNKDSDSEIIISRHGKHLGSFMWGSKIW